MELNPRQMLGLANTRPSMQYQQLNNAYQSDPRRMLGQTLMGQGASAAPVRTPLQGLGRLSSALVGAYLQRKAGDAQVAREDDYRSKLGDALSGLDLTGTPGLNALSQVNPELALQTGVGLEGQIAVANASRRPTETFATLTEQAANNLGLDTSRGQIYQQSNVSGKVNNVSGTTASSSGLTPGRALEELYGLATAENLDDSQKQRLNFLNNFVKKPRPVQVPDGAGGFTLQMIPGFDALAQLQSNASTTIDGQPPIESSQISEDETTSGNVVLGAKPLKLSAPESDFVANAVSAKTDLQTVIDLMFGGDLYSGQYNQTLAIASGSGVGRAVQGAEAQQLYDALSNLVDLRLRDRTGATANPFEVTQYLEGVTPGVTTRPDAARAKIGRLVTEINAKINAFGQGRNIPNLQILELPDPPNEIDDSSMTVNIPGT